MRKVLDERVGRQSPSISESQSNNRQWAHKELTSAQRTALEVALKYPVFPCDPTSKRPLTKSGFKDASQEPGRIVRWWKQYPGALVGVPCGRISGLLAVDVDPKGVAWYLREKRRLGAYRLHQTRRGRHLLFKLNGQDIGNSAGLLSTGVDVRGEGGYVIWWPAHGGAQVGEPGEIPHWVESKLVTGAREQAARDAEYDGGPDSRDTRKFREGERNDALSRRAYYYHRMNLSTREVEAALLKYDLEHCEPPYQTTNGERAVRYIARKKAGLKTDQQENQPDPDAQIVAPSLAEVEERQVDWLWKGFLARGKLHILAGAGGTYKSTLTLDFAATLTRGRQWPDGTTAPRGRVIVWTGEDDINDTVKPRFRVAGGDEGRCRVVRGVQEEGRERPFDPARDLELLERQIIAVGEVSLIILDPIVVIVQGDNNAVNDVRKALWRLQQLAEKHRCAILGIQHFNKGSKGRDPNERVVGSGAWVQAARIVMATAPINTGEGKDPTDYVLAVTKTFAKKQDSGYEYSAEEESKTETARIKWGKELTGTGHAIITEAEGGADGESKVGEAMRFLRNMLEKGSMPAKNVILQALDTGIAEKTLQRAAKALNVNKYKAGKEWRWSRNDE